MDKRRALYYGLALGIPLLNYARKALTAKLTPEPKTCPKCSYRMVSEIRRMKVQVAEKEGGHHKDTLGYWRCSACRAQYKRLGQGPFMTPAPNEWATFVGGGRP